MHSVHTARQGPRVRTFYICGLPNDRGALNDSCHNKRCMTYTHSDLYTLSYISAILCVCVCVQDDAQALKPAIFVGVPRVWERVKLGVEKKLAKRTPLARCVCVCLCMCV